MSDASQHVEESLRDLQTDVSREAGFACTMIGPRRCQTLFNNLGYYRCSRFGHISRDFPQGGKPVIFWLRSNERQGGRLSDDKRGAVSTPAPVILGLIYLLLVEFIIFKKCYLVFRNYVVLGRVIHGVQALLSTDGQQIDHWNERGFMNLSILIC